MEPVEVCLQVPEPVLEVQAVVMPEPPDVAPWERKYDCCEVQSVRGWLIGTVLVTTVHTEHCPVWGG
ncbi:hypothetical protein ACFW9I_34280 [[Kitasatospora] papulosa]|uniref:hypothetical protein n=1 Tax=[Kitasatospora] papulosa TaxID=1464011 RepID=UPI003699C9CD